MKHVPWTRIAVKNAVLPALWFIAICLVVMPADAQQSQQQSEPAKTAPQTGDVPKIKFTELSHDFGKTPQNTSVKYSYAFKNVGKGKLVIENVKAS